MRLALRIVLLVVGSAIYWAVAAFVILLAGWAIPGDCGTEQTAQGVHQCLVQVRVVVGLALITAVVVYGVGLWRIVRPR